ncbi:MAG: GNAT family N-acetyltransferase [Candidatus Latescibacteria bacterium]|nr:GNAT family N-acetyltransferase [Candidatus Latescibacterota bacterium]NIM21283.1 GNAT family N-acetyltransferase [Candidatus Latescibacterota bacterium]NIM64541.1 GNAT family N-acetyltransferase [Candidatus Latescibacterota bacterium]NIO00698.1 GNAT family N-acetyltransferase [Candidatus Latescibacterota bacterium]NIO27097.1 GNAT family N-acetyltransferase [Candidatus Latescibacterota bacterium]
MEKKKVKLKDGSEVIIRDLTKDDIEKSFEFFQKLPEEDRAYLRVDVTKRENVERRILAMEFIKVRRIVALANNEIVADGAFEMEGHGWKEHVGEIRLIVARPYQRKGLGMMMARELFAIAAKERVEEIVVKMMRPQVAAQGIFRKLGFHEEILLPEYVKDMKGHRQDMIIMRCDLEALWRELEHYIAAFDWWKAR